MSRRPHLLVLAFRIPAALRVAVTWAAQCLARKPQPASPPTREDLARVAMAVGMTSLIGGPR